MTEPAANHLNCRESLRRASRPLAIVAPNSRLPRLLVFVFLFFLGACESSQTGLLTGSDGSAIKFVTVELVAIDDEGNVLQTIETATSSEDGKFRFQTLPNTNASVIVRNTSGRDVLRSFYLRQGDLVRLHPLSEALVALVIDITSPTGGRSLSEFSGDELSAITEKLFAADISSLDLSNSNDVQTFVRSTVGRDIAIAAGGTVRFQATNDAFPDEVSSTATFQTVEISCPKVFLLTSTNFQFDIGRNGELCGNTSTTLSNILLGESLRLRLPDDLFHIFIGDEFPSNIIDTAFLENFREVRLGPHDVRLPNSSPPVPDTLQVARKVFVPENGDYIRYLEIFTNSGASSRTITNVRLESMLETGSESEVLVRDTFGGANTSANRFVAMVDRFSDRPTVGFVVQDENASNPLAGLDVLTDNDAENNVTLRWENLVVPANGTVTLLHYVFLSVSRSSNQLMSDLTNILNQPDMSGMSLTELAALANFSPNRGTIAGDAGSVIGLAQVTATNQFSNVTVSVTARRDGSFAIPLDVSNGDTVTLTASDGLSTTVTVQDEDGGLF